MEKVTASIGKEKYKTTIKGNKHEITVDEPASLGGADTGFSPGELLAASLASCTAITLRMYAERKKWDIGQIDVDVNFKRDAETGTTKFVRTLYVESKVDESQRKRLYTIANACHIHKILSGNVMAQTGFGD